LNFPYNLKVEEKGQGIFDFPFLIDALLGCPAIGCPAASFWLAKV